MRTTIFVAAAAAWFGLACSSGDDTDGVTSPLVDGGGGATGTGGAGGAGGSEPPLTGFSKIHADIIVRGCTGPLCHSSAAGGNLIMQSANAAYDALIDQPAEGVFCGLPDAGSWIRVVPGDPDASLLYQKLFAPPPCGDQMPVATLLEDAQIEEIRAWIADGAPRD